MRKVYLIFSLLSLSLLFMGCQGKDEQEKVKKDISQANDYVYQLAVNTSAYAPFCFRSSEGELVGFDMDLIAAIAKEEGFLYKIHTHPFQELFAAIESGERDMMAAGITITEDRKKRVHFSIPYFKTGTSFITIDPQIKSSEDLENKTFVVVEQSSHQALLSKMYPNHKIHTQATVFLLIKDVLNGYADVAFADTAALTYHLKHFNGKNDDRYADIHMIQFDKDKEVFFGIGVHKKRIALLQKINRGLETVMKNGEYLRIHKKWFGEDVPPSVESLFPKETP